MSRPVVSVAQMRQWEQVTWDSGVSQAEVIARAGQAVGRRARALTTSGDRILILAGKGHNGDDARGAGGHLQGRETLVVDVQDPVRDQSRVEALLRDEPALLIDGLFGIGLNRPLDSNWARLIESINRANLTVLAVDVPSGLNAETGAPSDAAIVATVTVTLGAPKRGLVAPCAHFFVGRLELASEIGLIRCPFKEELQWTEESDFKGFPPRRSTHGHKGTYGHAAIFAGSEGYHGAAVLAARGAQRARPGLISVFCAGESYLAVASQLQAPMAHSFRAPVELPSSCSALVIGPGLASSSLGPAWRSFVGEQWQESRLPVVVDASALAWIGRGPTRPNAIRVITPHPGEAGRMLGSKSETVQANRVEALRELSRSYGHCWVVLKGNQTLIGRSSGEVFVNPSGNPFLAQGGAGDVLAGYLGGLLAQPALQANPREAIRYAVWQHGATADHLTDQGRVWTVEDLAGLLGDVPLQRSESRA